MSDTREDALRELQGLFDTKQHIMLIRYAKSGDGTGADTCDVDGKPGWIWVRFEEDQSKVSKVFCEIRGLPEDVPLVIGKPYPGAEHEQVLLINWTLYYQGLTNLVLDQFTNPPHGDSHGERGSDRVPVGLRNMEPGRVREMDPLSLTVWVETFHYTYGSTGVIWPGGGIDLTASVPAGVGHRYTLVSLNIETNTLLATDGDIVPLAAAPDLPGIPIGHIPLAYIDIAQNETEIDEPLIYDGRLLWNSIGGVADHTHSGSGDGGSSLMCIEELFLEDMPVVLDGSAITPYAAYHTMYISGLYPTGQAVLDTLYPDESYAGTCPQMVILRPGPFGLYDTYEIRVKHNEGNIFLSGEQDIVLDKQTDVLWLVYNGTYWVDLPGLTLALRSDEVRIGRVTEYDEGMPGYGTKLLFSGGPSWPAWDSDNSDPLWMARYNVDSDQTEWRINIGDNGIWSDRVVFGYEEFGVWYPKFYVGSDGTVVYTKNAEPPDASIETSEFTLWLDDTPGSAQLQIKARDSNGTIVTGSVALT